MTTVCAEVGDGAAQEREHLCPRPRVEVAGGLIGVHDLGLGGERTCDGDPLLLPAGQLRGAVVQPVRQADGADDMAQPRFVRLRAGEVEREGDVLLRGQHRQQVVGLEDEAEPLAAQQRELSVGQRPELDVAQPDLPAGERVEPCEAVQQG